MDTESVNKPHLADYARPVWQRRWLIIVAVLLATVGVYAFYASKPDVFSAGTLVYTKDPGDPVTGLQAQQSTDRTVQNQASLLYSRDIATTVKKEISYPGTAQQLLASVKITARSGEDFVGITSRASSPKLAADIANGYARAFVSLSNTAQQTRIRKALAVARSQLKALPKSSTNSTTRNLLGDQIRGLELAEAVPSSNTRQVDPALAPTSPAAPKPLRNALFALVLSLVLAVGIAFGLERFDRRVKLPGEIEGTYELPLMAVLPHAPSPALIANGLPALDTTFREVFRTLRTNIELANLDRVASTLLVTSAVPGEGKSTVARNLAIAYRETGRTVVIVEADLRRPGLSRLFGHGPGEGLTEALSGQASLDEVLVEVPVQVPGLKALERMDPVFRGSKNGGGHEPDSAEGMIWLLRGGARPANPPAVLDSDRTRELLDELAARFDVLIIDSAPLLSVTDSVPLLRYADSTLVVGRLGVTTRDIAKRLVEFISRVPGARPLGVVANDLSLIEATGYGYGGYGYGYGEADKEHRAQSELAT